MQEVGRQAARAARSGLAPWRGLAAVGTIGWLVVLPAVAGALAGRWLDARFGTGVFWTLALLVAGLVAGCAAAWRYAWEQLGGDSGRSGGRGDRVSGGNGDRGSGGNDDQSSGVAR